MTTSHEALKHAGDIGATATGLIVLLSHWAEVLTPILTFLIALATLAWWALRFIDRVRKKKEGKA